MSEAGGYIRHMTPTRRELLELIKREGPSPIGELAKHLGVSSETVRQHLAQLERDGWIGTRLERNPTTQPGRPAKLYSLTIAGEHLFPKRYDDLAVILVDTMVDRLGGESLRKVLSGVVDAKIKSLGPKAGRGSIEQRLEALKDIYIDGDPFVEVRCEAGRYRLIEHNCPFLNVAMRRPALCSLTVNVLTRLLGCRVVRNKRFQDGEGLCEFVVCEDQPIDPEQDEFFDEPEAETSTRFTSANSG